MFDVRVSPAAFDLAAEHARLAAVGPAVGAIVSFTGQVRDHRLMLEHWPGVAERRIGQLVNDARGRWPLLGAIVVHRFGTLDVGDPIVLVLTASSHRAAAFDAASFLMDGLKTGAPFWKRSADGWVEETAADDAAAARWRQAPSAGHDGVRRSG